MGRPSFTAEHFFEVMRRYNEAVWPAQLGLYVLALVAIAVAWRGAMPRASRIVSGILALLFLIPIAWAMLGEQAALYFGVREDLGLTVAGMLAVMALFPRTTTNRTAPRAT